MLLLVAVPACAQVPEPPRNTASCAYDSLSAEDREIALLLIAREIIGGARFDAGSPNVAAVERLIGEARTRCMARFNWAGQRAETASGYAITALLREAILQAVAAHGLQSAPLDAYYTGNRAALASRRNLRQADTARLRAYLSARGWAGAGEGPLAMAGLYIETRMLNDSAARLFAAAD